MSDKTEFQKYLAEHFKNNNPKFSNCKRRHDASYTYYTYVMLVWLNSECIVDIQIEELCPNSDSFPTAIYLNGVKIEYRSQGRCPPKELFLRKVVQEIRLIQLCQEKVTDAPEDKWLTVNTSSDDNWRDAVLADSSKNLICRVRGTDNCWHFGYVFVTKHIDDTDISYIVYDPELKQFKDYPSCQVLKTERVWTGQ